MKKTIKVQEGGLLSQLRIYKISVLSSSKLMNKILLPFGLSRKEKQLHLCFVQSR